MAKAGRRKSRKPPRATAAFKAIYRHGSILGEAMARIIEDAAARAADPQEADNLAFMAQQFRAQLSFTSLFGAPGAQTLAGARRRLRRMKAMVAGALRITNTSRRDLALKIDELDAQKGYWDISP